MVFPRAHQLVILYQMVSLKNTHTNTLYGLIRVYLGIYTYTHAITTNDTKGHQFEQESGGVSRQVWSEEREKRNVVIML